MAEDLSLDTLKGQIEQLSVTGGATNGDVGYKDHDIINKLEEGRKLIEDSMNIVGIPLLDDTSFKGLVEAINLFADKILVSQEPPSLSPKVESLDSTSVTLISEDPKAKIVSNDVLYDSPITFNDLVAGNTYTFYLAYPADDELGYKQSEYGPKLEVLIPATLPGPDTLFKGDENAGYYGKVNNIITSEKLLELVEFSFPNIIAPGDITWLKFSHKGLDGKVRTLYVADRCIIDTLVINTLLLLNLTRGTEVTIGNIKYLLRSIRVGNTDPINSPAGGFTFEGSEWDDLIATFTSSDNLSHWSGHWTVGFESAVNSEGALRGNLSLRRYATSHTGVLGNDLGWRPVLEVIE